MFSPSSSLTPTSPRNQVLPKLGRKPFYPNTLESLETRMVHLPLSTVVQTGCFAQSSTGYSAYTIERDMG
ncbi:hypothetical protein RSAG8_08767, partial [Rhizoctonia solani AG-8 WAC10335]